jgi:RTX calcium-binding nonapeptide repeat (4 copies)
VAIGLLLAVAAPAGAATRIQLESDGTVRLTNRGGQVHFVSTDGGRYSFSSGEPVRADSPCRRWGGGTNARCPADRVRRIVMDLGPGADSALIFESVAVPVEVRGGPGDDYLEAGQRPGPLKPWEERRGPAIVPVQFDGGQGVDTIIGGGRDDILSGGSGPDRLFAGSGRDSLSGGAGDDWLVAGDGEADLLFCGAGSDRLRPDESVDAFAGCEQPPAEWGLEESPAIVDHRFAAFRDGRTRLTRLRARALPAGAAVTVRCNGSACPFRSRRDADAAPRWSAPQALLRRRLATGTRVRVEVAAPGHLTKVVDLRMRRGAGPARRVTCAGPFSGLVTTCLSVSWKPKAR